jgi:hypothetical protein
LGWRGRQAFSPRCCHGRRPRLELHEAPDGPAPSSRALILDQVPEALLPALVCKSLLALAVVDIALIVALFTFGEMLLSRLLFKLHVRDQPY